MTRRRRRNDDDLFATFVSCVAVLTLILLALVAVKG